MWVRKIFDVAPIPQFDAKNGVHRQLAALGKGLKHWLASGSPGKIRSIGKLRGMVREMLKDELRDIDELVKEILK